METRSTDKKQKFLSKIREALDVMPSITTEEDIAMNNLILKDLIRLENTVSSGSAYLIENCDTGDSDGFNVVENPMALAHRLN